MMVKSAESPAWYVWCFAFGNISLRAYSWVGGVCVIVMGFGEAAKAIWALRAQQTPPHLCGRYIRCSVYHIIPRRENALAVSLLWSSLKVMGRDERNINLALCITARERERAERAAPTAANFVLPMRQLSNIYEFWAPPLPSRVRTHTQLSPKPTHTF